MSPTKRGIGPILAYTALRLGLFAAVWLVLQLLTTLRGLWAIVVAILVSGLISIFVLNRQRTAMGDVIGGFFGRINARIDAASRAEDELDAHPDDQPEAQPEGIRGHEESSAREGGNQVSSEGANADDAHGSDSPGNTRQSE